MIKSSTGVLILLIILVIGGGTWIVLTRPPIAIDGTTPTPVVVEDPLNTTYTVQGEPVVLTNGVSSVRDASTTVRTALFGQPVLGDLNGDGKADAVVLLTRDTGGSGTFYYVAAALNSPQGMKGTNAVLLGDRIAPQPTQIQNGTMIINYADRAPGEPMTTPPSVGVSAYFTVEGMQLRAATSPEQTISYLVSSSSSQPFCNGDQMDSVGYQKTLTVTMTTSTAEVHPTLVQRVRETLSAATTGMCRTALNIPSVTVENGTVTIPPIDGWAGISMAMCSCKPEVETNLLRISGVASVVWK